MVMFCYYLQWGDTVVLSGLYARLCHAFLVSIYIAFGNHIIIVISV